MYSSEIHRDGPKLHKEVWRFVGETIDEMTALELGAEISAWCITTKNSQPDYYPDAKPGQTGSHACGMSGCFAFEGHTKLEESDVLQNLNHALLLTEYMGEGIATILEMAIDHMHQWSHYPPPQRVALSVVYALISRVEAKRACRAEGKEFTDDDDHP